MASTFKNFGLDVKVDDNSTNNLYTAGGSVSAVVHALYISNKSATNVVNVNIKATTDGGSTFFHIGKSLEVDVNNTLVLDKPINLESSDVLRIFADPITATRDVKTVDTITGGTGGSANTYSLQQTSTTGSGTNAVISAVLDGTSTPVITISAGGTGHEVGDVITFGNIAPDGSTVQGGGMTDITVRVASTTASDSVDIEAFASILEIS